ncbi:MAG TPA: DNA polymerase III subunit delta [Gammaproteobacteria bacterium]|nr:DNA polymerase III subunit delta [Gammaproteobacteria bacterium]
MKIPHKQLQRHLRGELSPAYLVAGDEPLLLGEALADIRDAGRRAGFEERELHVVDRSFRWEELAGSADNLSLFALRKLVELRLASPRPGDAGARSLKRLLARPDPDRLLLVGISGKLDAATAKSAWVKAFEDAGVLVEVWPVERPELPRWIEERAAKHRLKLTRAASEALAERVEGNLLAADQELRKLALTDAGGEIDEPAILEAVANSARFDVFRLTDAVLAGNAGRALRVLAGLRAEGVPPVLVSWALSRELSLLTKLKFALAGGERVEAVFARHGVWRRRQSLVAGALKRYEWEGLKQLLTQTVEVDALVKGGIGARPWDALARLVTSMLDGQTQPRRGAA